MNMNKIGGKARGLERLAEAGFSVPKFRAFSGAELGRLSQEEIARTAHGELRCRSYCVRSSAEIEDTAESSMAGQFYTELDVAPSRLAWAIERVLEQAKGLVRLSEFGIVIQEFIYAKYSGVLFTRDPSGGREMVLQYVKGRGDALVSGEKTPTTERALRDDASQFSARFTPLKKIGLEVEKLFSFPQDIEWVDDGNRFYFVQSRPITTLTKEVVESLLFLESSLPKGAYYFEKTGVTEIAPTPSVATLALLRKLYEQNGPVDRVYQKHGVTFTPHDPFFLFDGQLYVDREKELWSLLPAYSYFGGTQLSPRPVKVKGILASIKNLLALGRMRFDLDALERELFARLERPSDEMMQDYALIFEINLATEQAFKVLEAVGEYSVLELLAMNADGIFNSPSVSMNGMIGNGIELGDTQPFYQVAFSEPIQPLRVLKAKVDIRRAQRLERFREYGRWLTVIHINRLRKTCSRESLRLPVREFNVELPKIIASVVTNSQREEVGVSGGEAGGIVVMVGEIDHHENPILCVDQLSPNLTQYFGRIAGILSTSGGLLSHLAIVAREAGIPVVVTSKARSFIGKGVRINGSTGEVKIP